MEEFYVDEDCYLGCHNNFIFRNKFQTWDAELRVEIWRECQVGDNYVIHNETGLSLLNENFYDLSNKELILEVKVRE